MNKTFSPLESIRYGWDSVMKNKLFWVVVSALMLVVSGDTGYSSSSSDMSGQQKTPYSLEQNMYLNDMQDAYEKDVKMMQEPTTLPEKMENVLGAMDTQMFQGVSNETWGWIGLGVTGLILLALPFMILMVLVQQALTMGFLKLGIEAGRGHKVSFEVILSEMDLKKSARFVLGAFLYAVTIILGLIAFVLPGLYMIARYTFVTQLIVDKNLSISEAFKTSASMTSGNIFKILLFVALLAVLNVLGALAFLYGLLITLPVSLIAGGHVYKQLSK